MKFIILAGALAFSGVAMAESAPAPVQTPPQPPVAQQPVTTVTTVTDSSGTPQATVVNVASPGNYTPPPPPDSPATYPPCSRTVRDHCKQHHDRK